MRMFFPLIDPTTLDDYVPCIRGLGGGGEQMNKVHCRTREHKKLIQVEKPTPNQGVRPQPLFNKISPFRDLVSSASFLAIPSTNGMGTTNN